VTPFSCS